MAAPADKTIKNLDGRWSMNKTVSDDPDPVLALQGIGYLTRKAIAYAPITLDFKQYDGPANAGNADTATPFTHIDIVQTVFRVSSTEEPRCLDGVWRPRLDKVFGAVEARSVWVSAEELRAQAAGLDAHLAEGWLLGEAEDVADGRQLVLTEARSTGADGRWDESEGWYAWQVWGFREVQGVRRHARNVVAKRGGKTLRIVLYYDYEGAVP